MKKIVLIAHDAKKRDMIEWVRYNRGPLSPMNLYATRATGEEILAKVGIPLTLLLPGPEGGDAQVGAMIAERRVDMIVFLWDPLSPQPHDVDVKALLRLAVLHNIPIACNRRTADFLISSPLYRERADEEEARILQGALADGRSIVAAEE